MEKQLGVWIIGIYGEVASATILGAKAISAGFSGTTGLVTEIPALKELQLLSLSGLVFGGHDIRKGSIFKSIYDYIKNNRVFDIEQLSTLRPDIEKIENSVCPGSVSNCGEALTAIADNMLLQKKESLYETASRISNDILKFKRTNNLASVIVINLASAEQEASELPPASLDELHAEMQKPVSGRITASMIYAYAAFMNGFPYINFTPSAGSSSAALQEFAISQGVPHYGNDAKTGETLIKTVLAPMFVQRNLEVMSWEGYNLLGNSDGRILQHEEHKKAKLRHKGSVLPGILGYTPHSGVSIDYVPSLGDWKTAWDFIHFKGFLDTPMSIQFIWQGCDSMLAAPLVLDLIRMAEFASRNGEKGLLTHLACFFKNPIGIDEHWFSRQHELLIKYVNKHAKRSKDE